MSFCAGFFWAWLLWVFKTLEPFGLCPSTFGFLKAAFSPNSFGLFYFSTSLWKEEIRPSSHILKKQNKTKSPTASFI